MSETTVLKKPPPTDVLLARVFLTWAKDRKPCQVCSGSIYRVQVLDRILMGVEVSSEILGTNIKTSSIACLTLVCDGCGLLLIFSREKVLELVGACLADEPAEKSVPKPDKNTQQGEPK